MRRTTTYKLSLSDRIYPALMNIGKRTGCHQRADRSFFINGYQFPICARCTGVLIGYVITIPIYLNMAVTLIQCILFSAVMFIDWFIQRIGLLESTNIRRLITGIFGGFGVFAAEIIAIEYLVSKIFETL